MSGVRDVSALATFLEQKGAVPLVCQIELGGSQFSQLVERVEASRSTVSSRLDRGVELGVFEQKESGAYVLSSVGLRLRVYLDRHGLTERYRVIHELHSSFDQEVDELQEWVVSNEDFPYSEVEDEFLSEYFSGSLEE